MHEINRVLSAAAWRMGVVNFFRGLVYALAAIGLGQLDPAHDSQFSNCPGSSTRKGTRLVWAQIRCV